MLRSIVPAPGKWISITGLHNIRAIVPLRSAPIPIKDNAAASQARVVLATLPTWPTYYQTIERAKNDMSSLFSPPHPLWVKQSAAMTLYRTHQTLIQYRLLRGHRILDHCVRDAVRNVDKPEKVQKALMTWQKKIRPPFNVDLFLRRKWKKWFAYRELKVHVVVARKIACLIDGFPQHILNTITRSWTNSWVTGARFQSYGSRCPLCEEWFSRDGMEHIAVCKVIVGLLRRCFRVMHEPPSLARFLLLEVRNQRELVLQSLHLHAVYSMYNKITHRPHIGDLSIRLGEIAGIYDAAIAGEITNTAWGRNCARKHGFYVRSHRDHLAA